MVRIILVGNDENLRENIAAQLLSSDYTVVAVSDSSSFYRELLQRPADIAILNVGLIEEDGFAIARHLRAIPQTQSMGIIMLTSQAEANSRVKGLESGADMYLVKPVVLDELCAYIKSLHRRLNGHTQSSAPSCWRFCKTERKLVTPSGNEVELTYLESIFMEMIAHQAGHPVKRREIISLGFGQDPLTYDIRRLEAIVSRLRKKIRKSYLASQPVKAIHAVGYMFADTIECAL